MSELRWASPNDVLRNTITGESLVITDDLLEAFQEVDRALEDVSARLEIAFKASGERFPREKGNA